MKTKHATLAVLAALLTLAAVIVTVPIIAQQEKKKPLTWEEKKAERFTGPSEEQQALIDQAVPKQATVAPKKARRVLDFFFCEGFVHTSIPFGSYATRQMGEKTGAFAVDSVETYDAFTPENLEKYDVILFNNSSALKPDDAQKQAILDFVNQGKGIVGYHAASDSFGSWEEGVAVIGGIFNGHPWGAGGTWAFKNEDPEHPLNAAFEKKGFWHHDEIYWYRPENFQGRERLRVLLSLDMTKAINCAPLENPNHKAKLQGSAAEVDVPVSWCRKIGQGRLFYTNFGHRDETFWNPKMLRHMLDGIQFAAGDLEADATPSAQAGLGAPVLAPEAPEETE